jgi:hypothetical protein
VRGLAAFVMRGRSQAAMGATVPALLALLLPLLSIISSAVVALVTLRKGAVDGLAVGAISAVASALLAYLVLGSPAPVTGFLLLLWLPVWLLGLLLRGSRSLALAVQVSLAFGLLLVVTLYVRLGDPQSQWAEMLRPLAEGFVQSGLLKEPEGQTLVQTMALWLTGIFAAGFYLQLVLALFLARAWQAQLYNPGGFGAELRELRAHWGLGLLSLPLLAWAWMQGAAAPALVRDLALLVLPLWLVQGLAMAHGLVAQARLHGGWLAALYLLLIIAAPQSLMLMALAGLVDVFLDLRGRLGVRGDPGDP